MIKGRCRNSFILVFIIFISLASCNRDVVFTDSKEMPEKTWGLMNTPVFNVPINDTLTGNNVMLTIRTGSSYPFRNIYLFITTTSPEGISVTDTLQFALSDEKGNWYGKGFGDIHELKLPYKSNVYFPAKGTYSFKIQHGMRMEDLKGVYDFGIRIQKISK